MKKIPSQLRSVILYYSSFLFMGIAAAVIGPSLLQLSQQTGTTLEALSVIFPTRAGAYMLGSGLAGWLFDRFTGKGVLAAGLLLMGVTLALVPLLSTLLLLMAILFLMGISMGLVDVGCNTLLMNTRVSNLSPYMNTLHFFFGVGTFFAPLVLAGTIRQQGGIRFGYWGLALVSLLVLVQLINLRIPLDSRLEEETSGKSVSKGAQNPGMFVFLIVLFFFFYVGVEVGFGNWISTFSLKINLTGEVGAAVLTSAYWGAFTLGRLISIPVSIKIPPSRLVLFSLLGAWISLGLILLFPASPAAVWAGSILLGLSISSIFPTMLSFSKALMPLSGKLTSYFFISGGLGAMFLPWLIGRFVERTTPLAIMIIFFAAVSISGIVYGFLLSSRGKQSSPEVTPGQV